MKAIVCGVALLAGASLTATGAAGERSPEQIERGKWLVEIGGCHDCHSPKNFTAKGPVPDMSRALSGSPAGAKLPPLDARAYTPGYWYLGSPDMTAWVGPWGQSFAANLTPDDQTGLGLWTEDVFVQAIRTGKHMGAGRPILPPMPIEAMSHLSDDDLKAMFAYLKSLPPIKNAVPQPVEPPAPPKP